MPYHHHFEKENDFSLPVTAAAGSTPYMHPEALQHVSEAHGHYPGHRRSTAPVQSQPAFSAPPFASAPTHPSLAELAYRLGRLELENSQLRQVQAEQGAHLTILRDLVAKHAEHGAPPPIKVQATTESSLSVYLKYVKADHSLLPDEQPGSDNLRRRADFPKVKYWKAQSWNQHEKKGKGSVQVGEDISQSGRARAASGENVSCLYIEDAHGIAVDGHCVKRIREFAYNFIAYMKRHKYAEPRWDDVDVSVRETFVDAIRRKWPEFQLCEDNWKAHQLMAGCYYDRVTRPPRVKKEDQCAVAAKVGLDGAKYILDNSDDSPVDSSGPPRATSVVTASSKREHPTLEELTVAGPSKRPRLSIETAFVDLSPISPPSPAPARATSVTPNLSSSHSPKVSPHDGNAPSSALTESPVLGEADSDAGAAVLPSTALAKGKQRAAPRKYADDLVHKTFPVSSIQTRLADSTLAKAAASVPEPCVPNRDVATPNMESTAASPAGVSKADGSASIPTTTPASMQKPVPAASAVSARSKQASRKPWPPPASEVQNKWVYGRDEWLPLHPDGTLAEFEHHYTHELTEPQRRKLAREYKKIAAARAASSAAG